MPVQHPAKLGEHSISHDRAVLVLDPIQQFNNVATLYLDDWAGPEDREDEPFKVMTHPIPTPKAMTLTLDIVGDNSPEGAFFACALNLRWIASSLDNRQPLPRLNPGLFEGDRADFADCPGGWVLRTTKAADKHEGLRPGVGDPDPEPRDQGVKHDPPLSSGRWFDGIDPLGGECLPHCRGSSGWCCPNILGQPQDYKLPTLPGKALRPLAKQCDDQLVGITNGFNHSGVRLRQAAIPSFNPGWCLTNTERADTTREALA
jgi:hypothetical protein